MEECEAKYAIFSGIETNETVNMGEKPYYDVFICAEKALEKQIPKKPDFTEDKEFALCPCCNGNGLADKQKYCNDCGQKLDWSEESEENNEID